MTKAFIKDSLKKFIKTGNRFLAILIITMVGVAFFTGLRSTAPSMEKTLEEYYKEYSYMDMEVISTTGFTSVDKEKVESIDNVEVVELMSNLDVTTKVSNKTTTVRLVSYDFSEEKDINKYELVKGSEPKEENEVLVDDIFFEDNNLKLGDEVEFKSGGTTDLSYLLKNTTYKIVGTVYSPSFLMRDRGSSYVGSGRLEGYFYVGEENLLLPAYTSMEIRINNEDDLSIFSDEYSDLVGDVKADIENVLAASQPTDSYFIKDHEADVNFMNYKADGERIGVIGLLIPILFFAISIMVTMTSMTRLVDTDLTLIGTYKALGYRNYAIASYYFIYAFVASFVGGILGLFLGYSIFPKLIINAFRSLYEFPDVVLSIQGGLIALSLTLAISFAVIPSFVIALKRMRKNPAILMRPVIPTKGKKILLERITPLWKRINFSNKVMIRNIFRYKKRFLMTVLGVAGCTSLIFAGFALRDAIKGIVDKQFVEIQHFDVTVELNESVEDDQLKIIYDEIGSSGGEQYIIAHRENLKIFNDDGEKGLSLMAFSGEDYKDFFTLRNRKSGEDYILPPNGALISEKIAKEYDLDVGDIGEFKNKDGSIYEIKIGGITENYINHYIYLSYEAYEEIFGNEASDNSIFINLSSEAMKDEDDFSSSILALNGVNGLSLNAQNKNLLDSSLRSLDFVVLVLILSAVVLIFVVLFSLTSINIEERKRELATLKVLGFRKKEMIAYIFKEIFILTIIGIIIGLILGIFIQRYIILTMETSILMFSRDIKLASYLYSIVLTLTFAGVVDLIMIKPINRIDMVSSLKSIE